MKDIPALFENDHCLILNKPPGLSVQGGKAAGVSLDSILSENYSPRPFLVHRLDRDTSGVILVAKTKEAAAAFSALFAGSAARGGKGAENGKKERRVVKLYLGVCSGVTEYETGAIRLDLDERGAKAPRKSETFFRRVSFNSEGACHFSLLELELGTGRTHQIRRHLSRIGHPLLGDDKYGDFPLNKKLRKEAGLKSLLLHASRLVMPHSPFLAGGLDITAPLPEYFFPFLPHSAGPSRSC